MQEGQQPSNASPPGANPTPDSEVLSFRNVNVDFGDVKALSDLSFCLRAGQTSIVYGVAGSGKSVMLKVAIGLVQATSGVIALFGEETTNREEEDLFGIRSRAGILFQESGLFDSLTVGDNVAYPLHNQGLRGSRALSAEEIDCRVREALRFVELEHTIDRLPSQLSGGQRRRVGIARATVTEPPLILYDSPTAGLDPITANTIMALIVKARDTKNTTSVVVTHRFQDGQIVANYRWDTEGKKLEPENRGDDYHRRTRFLVLGEGKLCFEGTEEELNAATDPYVSKFHSVRSLERNNGIAK